MWWCKAGGDLLLKAIKIHYYCNVLNGWMDKCKKIKVMEVMDNRNSIANNEWKKKIQYSNEKNAKRSAGSQKIKI